jgi:hypothetical protein
MPAPATPVETQLAPEAVFTSAAQTAEAKRLELAAQTPTRTASAPLPPPATPTLQVTQLVTATFAMPGTAAPTEAIVATGDQAEFIKDVNVPDGTTFKPNEAFTKTWRLRNSGSTTWTTGYSIIYIDGALMGAQPVVSLKDEVPPGRIADISVDMIAPADQGTYRGYWKLRNASGEIFGMGPGGIEAIWVEIVVGSALAAGTPTLPGGSVVTDLAIAVDESKFEGACPHTFKFTVRFFLTRPATVTFGLEVGNTAGVQIKLPPPATRNLESGAHTMPYELVFPSSLNGWARLHVTAPEELTSNPVSYTLTCT